MKKKSAIEPRVAILLAAYNGIRWIEEQVISIEDESGVDVHIYVSVDLSDDGTFEWCEEFSASVDNVTVLPYGERFGGAAKNFFRLIRDIDFSQYDFVALSDHDDIWMPDKLSHAIEKIREENVDAYSSNVTAFWNDGREEFISKSQPQEEFDYIFEAAGPGCTYVLSKRVAKDFQKFLLQSTEANNFILHDWLIYAYARSKGFSWFIDSRSSMLYRQHENNQVGVNLSLDDLVSRAKYIFWGGGLWQIKLLLNLLKGHDATIQRWSSFERKQRFLMALSSHKFRRKRVEKVYVFITLMLTLIFGIKEK